MRISKKVAFILTILIGAPTWADDTTSVLMKAISDRLSQVGKTNFQNKRFINEVIPSSHESGKHFLDADEGITAPEDETNETDLKMNTSDNQL